MPCKISHISLLSLIDFVKNILRRESPSLNVFGHHYTHIEASDLIKFSKNHVNHVQQKLRLVILKLNYILVLNQIGSIRLRFFVKNFSLDNFNYHGALVVSEKKLKANHSIFVLKYYNTSSRGQEIYTMGNYIQLNIRWENNTEEF